MTRFSRLTRIPTVWSVPASRHPVMQRTANPQFCCDGGPILRPSPGSRSKSEGRHAGSALRDLDRTRRSDEAVPKRLLPSTGATKTLFCSECAAPIAIATPFCPFTTRRSRTSASARTRGRGAFTNRIVRGCEAGAERVWLTVVGSEKSAPLHSGNSGTPGGSGKS